ncbi:winged helix-turn-helix domain-containing protein, partial [Rhizobium leguminosarum]|uniref:winged helix-turn-helix domain-containing protein n=1 Tax=Rhizobium leguminosarum TaxID=384 RepID=UPI003F99E636
SELLTNAADMDVDTAIERGQRLAEWSGESLELTGTEFSLLEVLARRAGQLVSKQDISKRAAGVAKPPYSIVMTNE